MCRRISEEEWLLHARQEWLPHGSVESEEGGKVPLSLGKQKIEHPRRRL